MKASQLTVQLPIRADCCVQPAEMNGIIGTDGDTAYAC